MSDHETPSNEMTRVSDATRESERRQAEMDASAGRMPTSDEERAAEKNDVDPSVAAAEKEATARGANQQGEGRIEG